MELRLTLEGGRGRCHSGGFLLRIMPPSWQPVPACASNGHSQAELLFFETTKIRIGRVTVAAKTAAGGPFFFETTKI